MKKAMTSILVLVCMMAVFSSSAWAERPIRILFVEALSGPPKAVGERHVIGTEFAVEEINAKGGLLGRKVELISEDNQAKPDIAIAKAQKYLMKGNVDMVFVAVGGHLNKAVKDVTRQHDVLHVNMTQADDATGKNFSYHSIRLFWNASMMGRGLVSAAALNKGFKKYYILCQDYTFGHDMAKAFNREIKKQIPDAQIVGQDFHPLWTKDLSPFLTKIKASGADVILSPAYGPDLSILLKQRRELGVKAPIVNHALIEPIVVRENPEGALGDITVGTWAPTSTDKASVDFARRYKERYKDSKYPEADCVQAKTYMATLFVAEGIKKAQSVKVDKLMPVLEGQHVESLNGEMYLRACDHQLQSPMPMVTVVSATPPYYSAPVMLPISATMIDETEVENDRCRRK